MKLLFPTHHAVTAGLPHLLQLGTEQAWAGRGVWCGVEGTHTAPNLETEMDSR